jgi:hypothetical protein
VGIGVGVAVGAGDGLKLGPGVGLKVGLALGLAVGAAVGMEAHAERACAPSVHVPAAQPWHRWYSSLSWYLPDGQWKQLVLPTHALYCPVAHGLQLSPLVSWNRPIPQAVHPVEPATACLPSSHAGHRLAAPAV